MRQKSKWVVRVTVPKKQTSDLSNLGTLGSLIECLRYAGVISIVEDTGTHTKIDVLCPSDVHGPVWAKMNAERIRSFMLKAEAIEKPWPW